MKMLHKLPLRSAFVFLPWLTFWNQGGANLRDHARFNAALARDASCKKIFAIYETKLVRTPESRAKGLSGRTQPMSSSEAMLFLFDSPQLVSFWMKDTHIPLQILFFDAKGRYAQSYEMPVEPDPSNPTKRYTSNKEVVAALEVAPKSFDSRKGAPYLCASTIPRH